MARNLIVGAVGRRGSGKSTAAADLVRRCPRLAIFDLCGEHGWVPNVLQPSDFERFIAWSLGRTRYAAALVPEDLDRDLALWARLCFERGDLVLLAEELPMYSQPAFLPPQLDRIVRLGRHRRISLLWTAQRAAEVPRRVTAATDAFILFRQTEPRDLDALAERCGAAISDRVASLGLHDSICWDVVADRETTTSSLAQDLVALYP